MGVRLDRVLGVLAVLAGCAGPNVQGPLQPQAVEGPCTVNKFFLLGFTTVHTEMAVAGTGQACVFTVLDPNRQVFPTANLVTVPPLHGRVTAGFTNGGRSPLVSYVPEPGYAGPDRFTVTIEPNNHSIAVAVTVGR